MDSNMTSTGQPAFYSVPDAAKILLVNPVTLYRAIREDAFPAVRIRGRYVIPAAALDRLIAEATESGGCIDPAAMVAERRGAREFSRVLGGGDRR